MQKQSCNLRRNHRSTQPQDAGARRCGRSILTLAALGAAGSLLSAFPAHAATDTWVGTSALFNAGAGAAFNNAPATGDSLVFGGAGLAGTTLTDNLFTPASFNIAGITFNSGDPAYIINPATIGTNGFTLTGNITNSGTALETINDSIATTAVRTITTTAGGGDVTLGGNISGTAGGITKLGSGTLTLSGTDAYTGATTIGNNSTTGAGTLTFGASNVLTSSTNVSITGSGSILNLGTTSQTIGTLTGSSTEANVLGATITGSSGSVLTINNGNNNSFNIRQATWSGGLAVVVIGNGSTGAAGSGNGVQFGTNGATSTSNTNTGWSGGLTVQGSGTSSLSNANLISTGLTGYTGAYVQANGVNDQIGTGTLSLNYGTFFTTGVATMTNAIDIGSRGGVLHGEANNTAALTSYSGTLSGTGFLDIANGFHSSSAFSGSMTSGDAAFPNGFTGTLNIDATNTGIVNLTGSALGNSNMILSFSGTSPGNANGTTVADGTLRWNGTASPTTISFGEVINGGGSTTAGFLSSGVNTTVTYSIGDTTSNTPSFAGVFQNGSGTVALTKVGTNTQTLSGLNTYTGPTNIAGGALVITGSLNASSAVTVNSGGILRANGSGLIAGPVSVNGGGQIGGNGTVSGPITLAAGSTPASQGQINLTGNSTGTFNVSNAAGLTLGGTDGNVAAISMNAAESIAISGPLVVNAGGASIYVTPGTAVAGNSYTLMTYPSASGAGFSTGINTSVGSLVLADPSISFGVSGVLNVSNGSVILTTSGAAAPANAFWSGAQGIHWTDTNGGGTAGNFTTTQAGGTFVSALPGPSTNVFFAGNGATNLTTNVLGQAFEINSLSFQSSTGAVAIGGSNSLQIDSGGITVNNTGGATIGTGSLVVGASQTWNNSSASPLTITAPVSGTGSVAIYGAVNLGGTSFSSGGLSVNGSLDLKGTSISTGNLNGSGSITNTGSTNATFAVNMTSTQAYSGTLADGGSGKAISLQKSGTGTLTLSGSNSYTGQTTVIAGVLSLGNTTALGSSNAVIDNGATLDLGGQTITNVLNVAGAGASGAGGALINSNTSSTAVVNADILLSPSFTVGGAGSITLQRVQSGSTFTLTDANTGTLTLGTSASANQDNLLSLVVNGGGTVLLNMPANFIAVDRGLTITNGTVQYTGASTNELTDGGTINMTAGGILDLNGHSDTVGAINASGGTITNTAVSTSNTYTLSTTTTNTDAGLITDGPSGGTIAIAVTGTGGIQTFSGNNHYSGGTTVSGGATLIMGSATALGQVPSALNVSAGTLDLSGHSLSVTSLIGSGATGNITSSGNTGAALTLTVNNSASNTYAGQISNGTTATPDLLSLVKNGSSTLTLSGASNFSGGTAINNGTVAMGTGTSLGSGPIVIGDGSTANGASLLLTGAGYTIANPITVAPGGTGAYSIVSNTNQDFTFTGAVNLSNALTVTDTQPHAVFLNGPITSGASNPNLTVSGGGTGSGNNFIALQGSNSAFTGNLLIVNNGFVKTHTGALNAANEVIMDTTARLDTGAVSLTIAGLQDVSNGSGGSTIINAGAGSNLTLAGAGTYEFSGAISSSGYITKTGTGTQILAGSNTYTGQTNVAAGTLVLASAGAFPANTALIVGATAQLTVANHGGNSTYVPQMNALTNAGTIDITNNALLVHNGSIGTINAQAAAAYNGGAWNGSGAVITSSTAAGDASHLTAVGVATGLTTTFEGVSTVPTDVLVKYTYYGDALLTGSVTSADYTQIDNGFLTGATGWQNGDFNYDNVINGSDYTLIDNAFNTQGAQINAQIASPTAQIAGGAASAVPEPTTLGLLGIGAVGLLGRRRKGVR